MRKTCETSAASSVKAHCGSDREASGEDARAKKAMAALAELSSSSIAKVEGFSMPDTATFSKKSPD